ETYNLFFLCSQPPFQRSIYCPSGWTLIKNRCFRYVSRRMSWATAEKNCLAMGANLASALIVKASSQSKSTWLGGSDAQQVFLPMIYTNWCLKEPNNYRGKQHCLQMNWTGKAKYHTGLFFQVASGLIILPKICKCNIVPKFSSNSCLVTSVTKLRHDN
uniref:C-type lectin domain-containing protein n=1 Tax=Poecilia reticulata TaxID=8081 RepID=A0A3P9NBH1_POERE